ERVSSGAAIGEPFGATIIVSFGATIIVPFGATIIVSFGATIIVSFGATIIVAKEKARQRTVLAPQREHPCGQWRSYAMSAATIAAALGDARREGRTWRCRCPLHGGGALPLRAGGGGRWLARCFVRGRTA